MAQVSCLYGSGLGPQDTRGDQGGQLRVTSSAARVRSRLSR
jgi:hypothetical protein